MVLFFASRRSRYNLRLVRRIWILALMDASVFGVTLVSVVCSRNRRKRRTSITSFGLYSSPREQQHDSLMHIDTVGDAHHSKEGQVRGVPPATRYLEGKARAVKPGTQSHHPEMLRCAHGSCGKQTVQQCYGMCHDEPLGTRNSRAARRPRKPLGLRGKF